MAAPEKKSLGSSSRGTSCQGSGTHGAAAGAADGWSEARSERRDCGKPKAGSQSREPISSCVQLDNTDSLRLATILSLQIRDRLTVKSKSPCGQSQLI